MADSYEDILNSLNEAMSIHAQKAIENLPFNKSELVEIVNDTMAEQNTYIVWNGSVRYEVFSTTEIKYNVGDKVYVTIPNGDFSQKKYIIGPYVDNNGENLLYQSPFANYKGTGENIFNENTNIYQLIISSKEDEVELNSSVIFQEDKNDGNIQHEALVFNEDGIAEKVISELSDLDKYNKGYKYLAFSADIMTDFFNKFSFGDYGLKIEITYNLKLETTKSSEDYTQTYYLDTNDMIGDLYNFSTYFNQKKLIQLEKDNPIKNIKVYLFVKNNFKPLNWDIDDTNFNCINFKNIKLEFGDPDAKIDERVYLYTLDGDTYDSRQATSANKKTLHVKWDHYDNTTETSYHYDEDSKNKNVEIHWYKEAVHSLGEQIENGTIDDSFLDVFHEWETAKEDQDKIKALIDTYGLEENKHYNIDNDNYTISDKQAVLVITAITNLVKLREEEQNKISDTLAGSGWTAIARDKWKLDVNPDIAKNSDKYIVIIKDGENIYRSNEYEFKNLVQVSDSATVAKLAGLKIICKDGKNGNYPIYSGNTGEILSKSEIIDRKLSLELNDPIDNKTYLNGNETIIWKIPKESSMTMIQMNSSFYKNDEIKDENNIETFLNSFILNDEDKNKVLNEKEKYYFIIRSRSEYPVGKDAEKDNQNFISQTYRVENFYNKIKTNNTIFAYVIKNNVLYEANKTFTFSQYGTSGSEYTFQVYLGNIVDEDGKFLRPAEPSLKTREEINEYHKLEIHLFNTVGEEITGISPSINWYQKPEDDKSIELKNKPFFGIRTRKNGEEKDNYKIEDYSYAILRVYIEYGGIKFQQLLPIHIRASDFDYIYNGPDKIIYDDNGTNPSQYNLPLSCSPKPLENIIYRLMGDYEENNLEINSSNKLIPSLIYFSKSPKKIKLEIYNIDRKLTRYTCPILITQNKYQIPLINQWNKSLTINQTENAILAATMVAGTKASDGTFTGLLMGQVKKASPTNNDTGLFGYNQGNQTFRLGVDGILTLGASGTGQIQFDGSSGIIEGSGMRIDLTKKKESIIFKDGKTKDWKTFFEIKSTYDNNDNPNGVEMFSEGKITINGAIGSKIHFGDSYENYIEMGYNNSNTGSEPYLKGISGGETVFKLGKDQNKIGNITITSDGLRSTDDSGRSFIMNGQGIYGNGWEINSGGIYMTRGYKNATGLNIDANNLKTSLFEYIDQRINAGTLEKSVNSLLITPKLTIDNNWTAQAKISHFPNITYEGYLASTAPPKWWPNDIPWSISSEDALFTCFSNQFNIRSIGVNGKSEITRNIKNYVEWVIEKYIQSEYGGTGEDGFPGFFKTRGTGNNTGKNLGDEDWNTSGEIDANGNQILWNLYNPDVTGQGKAWGNCTWSIWEVVYTVMKIKLSTKWGNAVNWYNAAQNWTTNEINPDKVTVNGKEEIVYYKFDVSRNKNAVKPRSIIVLSSGAEGTFVNPGHVVFIFTVYTKDKKTGQEYPSSEWINHCYTMEGNYSNKWHTRDDANPFVKRHTQFYGYIYLDSEHIHRAIKVNNSYVEIVRDGDEYKIKE